MIKTIKKLLGVNVFAQAVGLGIYPILLTFYSIEDLSIYGMLYGGMSIFSILLSFRLENLLFNTGLKKAYCLYSFYVKFFFSPILFLFIICSCFIISYSNNFLLNLFFSMFSGLFLALFNVTYNILVSVGNEKYNLLKFS